MALQPRGNEYLSVGAAVDCIARSLPFIPTDFVRAYVLDVCRAFPRVFDAPPHELPLSVIHVFEIPRLTACVLAAFQNLSFFSPVPGPTTSVNHQLSSAPSEIAAEHLHQGFPRAAIERKICKQFRLFQSCTFGSRCLYHHSEESAIAALRREAARHDGCTERSRPPKRERLPFSDLSNSA